MKTIDFIKHGANAIFKVTDTRQKKYLLRIDPTGYHIKSAILEEFKWLHHLLSTTDISVPKVISTKSGEKLVQHYNPAIGQRMSVISLNESKVNFYGKVLI